MKKWKIGLAAVFGCIILFILVPLGINELYKLGPGYITMWDAGEVLSYYGTSLAALLTAGSILVAIWQYKQPLVKYIKINFTSGFIVLSDNTLGENIHCISVSNTGIRPVIVTNVYMNFGSKNLVINNVQSLGLPRVEFPQKIDQEENIEIRLSCRIVSAELDKLISRGLVDSLDTLKIVVTDTTGGTHILKTTDRAKDLIGTWD